MHLIIIAAFIYLGLASPGSDITTTDIANHQTDIEQVQSDPEFVRFVERITACSDGLTQIYVEER